MDRARISRGGYRTRAEGVVCRAWASRWIVSSDGLRTPIRPDARLASSPLSLAGVATSGTVAVFLLVGRQFLPLKLRYQFAANAKRMIVAVNIPLGILALFAYLTSPGDLFGRETNLFWLLSHTGFTC